MSDNPVFHSISSEIDANDGIVYERHPNFSAMWFFCRRCSGADHLGVDFKGINVLEDQDIREGSKIIQIGLPFRNSMLKANLLVAVILFAKCLKMVNWRKYLMIKALPTKIMPQKLTPTKLMSIHVAPVHAHSIAWANSSTLFSYFYRMLRGSHEISPMSCPVSLVLCFFPTVT